MRPAALLLQACLLLGYAGAGHVQRGHVQKGITYTNGKYCPNVTFASTEAHKSLKRLRGTGASHVAIIVTHYQKFHNSTKIKPLNWPGIAAGSNPGQPGQPYQFITASDTEVNVAIERAHRLGLKVRAP